MTKFSFIDWFVEYTKALACETTENQRKDFGVNYIIKFEQIKIF